MNWQGKGLYPVSVLCLRLALKQMEELDKVKIKDRYGDFELFDGAGGILGVSAVTTVNPGGHH